MYVTKDSKWNGQDGHSPEPQNMWCTRRASWDSVPCARHNGNSTTAIPQRHRSAGADLWVSLVFDVVLFAIPRCFLFFVFIVSSYDDNCLRVCWWIIRVGATNCLMFLMDMRHLSEGPCEWLEFDCCSWTNLVAQLLLNTYRFDYYHFRNIVPLWFLQADLRTHLPLPHCFWRTG